MAIPSLDRLIALVPPPPNPVGTGTPALWQEFETKIGTVVPEDYKQLIDVYGTGRFSELIDVFSPFYKPWSWHELHDAVTGRYTFKQDVWPEDAPDLPVFPTPGGLLTWGQDEFNAPFFWRTRGEPHEWSIVVFDSTYGPVYMEYEVTVTEFLLGFIVGEITVLKYVEPLNEATFGPLGGS